MIPAFDCMITDPPCKPRASGDDPERAAALAARRL